MKKRNKNFSKLSIGADIGLNIVFIIWTVLCIVPFLLILGISFSDENSILEYGYRIIPVRFSTAAYVFVTSETTSLIRAYAITIYATVAGTLLSVIITALFAYPLSRKDFQGGLVAGYMVYVEVLNLKNNLLVYLAPFLMSAWNVILMRTFMVTSIPDSLIDAAKIDGAGEWTIFNKIVMPLSLPGLATIALFTSIGIWNDWYTPLLYITDKKLYNLQFSLYSVLSNIEFLKSNFSIVGGHASQLLNNLPTQSVRMAMCIVSIGPIILAYPFFQKYFIKGLTIGAVKG